MMVRMFIRFVGAVVVAWGLPLAALAVEETAPFHLTTPRFVPIPDGPGISYIYGVWENPGAGGPLTITPDVLAFYESGHVNKEEPYRILHRAENYVLVVSPATYSVGEVWTEFYVLVLRSYSLKYPEPEDASLLWYSCPDLGIETAEAYTWSDEALLAAFHDGCGQTIRQDAKDWSRAFGEYWSQIRFYRP